MRKLASLENQLKEKILEDRVKKLKFQFEFKNNLKRLPMLPKRLLTKTLELLKVPQKAMELKGEETTGVTQSPKEEFCGSLINKGILSSYLAVPLAHRFKVEKR